MYEYLLEELINDKQIYSNLRRTMDNGLISRISKRQLLSLALKYFGVNDKGEYTSNTDEIVAYRCPYSGKIIDDYSKATIDHIIPFTSKGGTILFNCIPVLNTINSSKKDTPNILDWWTKQSYFDINRLERLLKYIIEGHQKAFVETEDDYYVESDKDTLETIYQRREDDLTVSKRTLNKKVNNEINYTYLQLLNDIVNYLDKHNINISKYKEDIEKLKKDNIFGEITEIEKIINIVQKIIKEKVGDDSKKYLSYSLKLDMHRLLESIKNANYEEEIINRFNYIENILKENNKDFIDYFENISDIDDKYNPLYYNINNIPDNVLNTFLANIKIGNNTKVNIFIDMLGDEKYTPYSQASNGVAATEGNIFKRGNKVSFKGYEQIDVIDMAVGNFWRNNKDKIKNRLKERINILEKSSNPNKEDELKKLKTAQRKIDEFEFVNGIDKKIDIFIDMLGDEKYTPYSRTSVGVAATEGNIFKRGNKVPFKGYEQIDGIDMTVGQFWYDNKDKIKNRLKERINILEKSSDSNKEEELRKLKIAQRKIEEYEFVSGIDKKIDAFIDMLSDEKYTPYSRTSVGVAATEGNIFSDRNKVPFKGYEQIGGFDMIVGQFWITNKDKIKNRLKERINILEKSSDSNKEELKKLKKIQRKIDEYEFTTLTGTNKKIDIFIDMLGDEKYTPYSRTSVGVAATEGNIFSDRNKVPFKGYEQIGGFDMIVGSFWYDNKDKIKNRLKERINILEKSSDSNKEEELRKLKIAQRKIEEYDFVSGIDKKIDIFIDMLNDDKYTPYSRTSVGVAATEGNIFNNRNKVSFKGYEQIDGFDMIVGQFWQRNKDKRIIPLLFYNYKYDDVKKKYVLSDKDYSGREYDKARDAVMKYLNIQRKNKGLPEFNNIGEYVDTLNKTKKEVKLLIELRDKLKEEKKKVVLENIELKNALTEGIGRAM